MLDSFSPDLVLQQPAPAAAELPQRLLYATSAGLGGTGLDSTSLEGARAAHRAGFMGRALCFDVGQCDVRPVKSLNWHPVRLLSCLGSEDYYAAKKRYVDWVAGRELRAGAYDAFHGWSGDCFQSLVEARMKGVPTVMDIPTWHRNKGVAKRGETKSERAERLALADQSWRKRLPIDRPRMLAEYELADIILVPSRKSAETFLAAGIPEQKLAYVGRGVDTERYRPGQAPQGKTRFIFVGALIKRKGVHHLLRAWKKLALRDAELVLVGELHGEMRATLAECQTATVRHLGFSKSVQDELRQSSVFVFPSECEGFAKTTLEAAACGLPLIATAESGDAVVDGVTGCIIPPNDEDALAAAMLDFHQRREAVAALGAAGRERVLRCLSWDHYRQRLLSAYAKARKVCASC
jgi:glycosyltransferase involved in cell wall biosynthesis